MSRFNQKAEAEKTITNAAGGDAYKQSPEMELVSILLTSFANEQFYRSAKDSFERLKELIAKCNPKFVAQAAVYARTQFGMRSISHVAASEVAKHLTGEEWAKDFYSAIVHRPDDMMEILAYHQAKNGKIPNSMKKGFANAFGKFDAYALSKYRGEGKEWPLVDIVNLVHPVPTEGNSEALKALMKGELKSTQTWESKLTKAGQEADTEEEKEELKKDAWVDLVRSKKIPYFALLKNLRNIIQDAPEVVNEAIEILTNEALIKKSLVLPFRFITAYTEIVKLTKESGKDVRAVLVALNKAIDISLNNVPKFDGDTLVVLDVSSSMRTTACDWDEKKTPALIGSLFSTVLVKANNADIITFDEVARYVNVNPSDSTITIANGLQFNGGGTDFTTIFPVANKKYDRVIILSDMQGWMGGSAYGRFTTPVATFNEYRKRTGANPYIYSFDLKSYGSMQFPESKAFCLAGFSDKIFDTMGLLEKDRNALVNEVKKVQF